MKANWLAAAALLAAGTDAAAAPQVPGTLAGVKVSFSSRPKVLPVDSNSFPSHPSH